MKASNISSELKFVNKIGATLSLQERIQIQAQALKLSQEYPFEQWNFWGRVDGISKNYYVVEGVNFKGTMKFPTHKYFWALDDFKFSELPNPRLESVSKVEGMDDFFTGQPEKILFKAEQSAVLVQGAPRDLGIKDKNFTQLDRLSLVVAMISYDCSIVPLGAYKMIPTHELVENSEFMGLKVAEAKKAENYVHLRYPQTQDKKILIECDKALERSDFMDSITEDKIKQCWSIQSDESGTEVTIRNLSWQGYVGYHRTNSAIFGGVYVGNGIKCNDIPFLL